MCSLDGRICSKDLELFLLKRYDCPYLRHWEIKLLAEGQTAIPTAELGLKTVRLWSVNTTQVMWNVSHSLGPICVLVPVILSKEKNHTCLITLSAPDGLLYRGLQVEHKLKCCHWKTLVLSRNFWVLGWPSRRVWGGSSVLSHPPVSMLSWTRRAAVSGLLFDRILFIVFDLRIFTYYKIK
jgi:hypothetical protein